MTATRHAYTALTPETTHFVNTPVHTPPSTSRIQDASCSNEARLDLDELYEAPSGRLEIILAKLKVLANKNTGLLLVASSQAFFTLMNLSVKKLNAIDPPVSTFELITVRMVITYVCSIAYMLLTKVPDPVFGPEGVRLLLVSRGFFGFFGLFGIYYSLEYLSLSDATVLTFLSPMCTAVAGALFLGEKFLQREALAGLVSIFGVVLIARPTFLFGATHIGNTVEKGTPSDRLIAVGVAMLGVLGGAGAYTSIRAIGHRAHPLHSMTFFSMLCTVVSIPAMIITKTPFIIPDQLKWLAMLIMIGIFGFVAQTLLTMGLQRETAGRASIGIYTQIVFAVLLERIFFKTVPTLLSMIGTLLILGAAIYVAATKETDGEDRSKRSKSTRLELSTEGAELEERLLSSAITYDADRR